MIETSRAWMLCLSLLSLAGCPVGPPETGEAAATRLPTLDAVAGSAAQEGGDALNALVLQAARDRFPPPPAIETLCKLQQGRTDFNAAKKILVVKPQGESQDATMAGLSYRFRPATDSGAAGAAGAGSGGAGGAGSDDEDEPITLYLTFAWSDGSPGIGTIIFGIGGSPEDLITGYVLQKMSISGMPYPACWPHEEE